MSDQPLTTECIELDFREKWLLQSALAERIIADNRSAVNPLMSKEGSEMFARDRDEKFELFKKLGGPISLDRLLGL